MLGCKTDSINFKGVKLYKISSMTKNGMKVVISKVKLENTNYVDIKTDSYNQWIEE